jgi:signal transduction histidine kinase/ActR/RegA family two-component response regulator
LSTALLAADLEKGIRAEQVRLVFRSMSNSLYLGTALAAILALVFIESTDSAHVIGWLLAVVLSRILCVTFASWALGDGISPENYSRRILAMAAIKVIEGLAWGSLTWIVLGSEAGLAGQLLALASLAGVSGNAVSLLAPVFPLYLSMQLAQFGAMCSKLLEMNDSSFTVLALGCLLFLLGQSGQALLAQRTSRESLLLRFENLDLIERLQVETERAGEARGRAEEANLAKSKFLAAASHDLRQPVHALELFLEVLARSELSDVQHKVLSNARSASQASAQMLNTLLDFSRIEAGVIEPHPRPFPLQPLLNKLENELGSQVDSKDIVYRCRETRLAVYSDPNLLELILRNLITNAIRYTDRGGLLIACRQRGDSVLIEVYDTGIGIDPSQQREIFREFHQLGNPERDRLKGLGLGLAITDGLARQLGHELSLSSRPGRGSVFRVRLPRARVPFAELLSPHSDSQLRADQLQGRRVLVIDDDASVRQAMLQLLTDWGCDCRVAEDIDEALAQFDQWQPELLISDYRLREEQTGAQAIQSVRSALNQLLPALIITGDTAPQRLLEARATGVPLLHKPVSVEELHRAMIERLAAPVAEPGQRA